MINIFLVDDDNISNFLNTAIIKRVLPDANVHIHKSAEELLLYIKENDITMNPPEIMLLDIRMPGISGFEMLESLKNRSDNPFVNTSIYILSSTLDDRDFERAKTCPFIKGFLGKPLSISLVEDVLQLYR